MDLADSIKQLQLIGTRTDKAEIGTDDTVSVVTRRDRVGDSKFDIEEERKLLEQTISKHVEILCNLKKRLNGLATINRLPVELFTDILLLAALPDHEFNDEHLYLPYTWVCHYWRSVLISNPAFWTKIRIKSKNITELAHPFVQELIRRTDTSELDLTILKYHEGFPSKLEEFFAKEDYRIRRLRLARVDSNEDLGPLFAGKRFPSLQGISCNLCCLIDLLPLLVASEHLKTLACLLLKPSSMDVINQLAPVFARIRNLHIETNFTPSLYHLVLDMLHNSVNLQNLHVSDVPRFSSNRLVLPELQFCSVDTPSFLEHILAPKLSSLAIDYWDSTINSVPEAFDFSSVRYLYILGSEKYEPSIQGYKEHTYIAEPLLSTKSKDFVETFEDIVPAGHIKSIQDVFLFEDFLSDNFPRDCFCFTFSCSRFSMILQETSYLLLPRISLKKIMNLAPSLEKLVVEYGDRLTDFIIPLAGASLCPRLKHLYFVTSYEGFIKPQEIKNYAENVGKTLTETLQSRHKVHNELKYIALHYCPPLPDAWLTELRMLGMTIVTAKNAQAGVIFSSWYKY